jgi:voltage-gated potassium channel
VNGSVISLRHVAYAVAGFVLIQVAGIVGFVVILDESVLDAAYRTVVLVSTVGLDTVPASGAGKIFSLAIIASGAVLLLYLVGLVIDTTARGIVTGTWLERRTRKVVDRLEDHYLICGFGRVGRRVADEFRDAGVAFVVVDPSPAAAAAAREHGAPALEESATDDEALQRAGIARARGLVACVDSDAENLYIVLSARELNPALLIVARASSEDAATKLRRGGADRVVTPYAIAGRELATLVLRPQVSAFLETVTGAATPEFRLEQIQVSRSCGAEGCSIRALRIREATGAMVIAHKRPGEAFNTRPGPDTLIREGDVLIGVGTPEEIRALGDLLRAPEPVA